MILIKAERPKRYTGPIEDCPTQVEVQFDVPTVEAAFQAAYEEWSAEFFEKHPNGHLTYSGLAGKSLVVRGTGDCGRWLVAWRVKN